MKHFAIGFAMGGSAAAAIDAGRAWLIPAAVFAIVIGGAVIWVGVALAGAAIEIPEGDK